MDDPKKYREWCKHYEYKPDSPEAKEDYQRYKDNLAKFQSILNEDEKRREMPPPEMPPPDEKFKTETLNIWEKVDSINKNGVHLVENNFDKTTESQFEKATHNHEMNL